MKKKRKTYRSLWAIALLAAALFAGYICAFAFINSLMKESCFDRLEQSASQLRWELVSQVKADTERLESLVCLLEISGVDDPETTRRILQSCQWSGLMTQVAILYPDNTVMWSDGLMQDADGVLSFEEISARGQYISRRDKCIRDSEKWVIRNFIPVKENGKTSAIVFGMVDLQELPDAYEVNVYEGKAELFLIEGETGEYILDTWHKTLGNTRDFKNREAKEGSSPDQFREDMRTGASGRLVYTSQSAGEDFYGYYLSVGINDWRMEVTVPESVAFAESAQIRRIFLALVVFVIVLFVIFLANSLREIRKDAVEKEKQLGQVRYMFDVEKLLFDAHRFPGKMDEALRRIGQAAGAGEAFFTVLENGRVARCHMWRADGQEEPVFREGMELSGLLPYCSQQLEEGESVVWNKISLQKETHPEDYDFFSGYKSIMLAAVRDADGKITGLLGTADMKYPCDSAGMLECVELSFSMALNNLKAYHTIREMGLMDFNTGLQNRNSYHRDLIKYEKESSGTLGCVYVDVNGLHEVNNCLGHDAGDEMLREIAGNFRSLYGEESTYRIGGDEFVAICRDMTREEILERTRRFEEAVTARGYHISTGVVWRQGEIRLNEMIRMAEQRMYEEKRRYYEDQGNVRKAREMNQRLETILTQKKDSEAFLSVLSEQYLGVYVVDLLADTVRYIYMPEYFKEMLKEAGGQFSRAQRLYEERFVHPDYQEAYRCFEDFGYLREQLLAGCVPEIKYRRNDGSQVMLRIYQNGAMNQERQETLWVYEHVEEAEALL